MSKTPPEGTPVRSPSSRVSYTRRGVAMPSKRRRGLQPRIHEELHLIQ